jgi:hypothetical protein
VLQEEMVDRLHEPSIVWLDCGHIPAVTHPHDLAAVLDDVKVYPA